MKTSILSIITFCLIASVSFAQSGCSKYYPFDEGTTFQITNYDKKGKTTGFVDYTITDVRTVEGAEVSTITSQVKDEKGELILESSYNITCKDDTISIDFNSMVNSQMFDQYQEFDLEISGTNLDLPNNLSVGQELPDASMLMIINMGITLKFSVNITDRKVIAKESVTTPAGTYDCFVISYSVDMKMGFKSTGTSKQWIAKEVGMVKQEEYNKKGKLMSSSQLTAFHKN